MTAFAALCSLCGLSQREASAYLDASPSSIDKMARGVRSTPAGILGELRALHRQQRRAAAAIIRQWRRMSGRHGAPELIELALSSDDHEARSKGWPCVGAERAAYALAIARIDAPAVIVPRGSTVGTAAAADAFDLG